MKSPTVFLLYIILTNAVYGIPQQRSSAGPVTNSKSQNNPIVYPSEDTNQNRTSTHNRNPVIDRRRCNAETELLYPGDNEADWVCDCKPGYIYSPQTLKCYLAHTRGPCASGYLLHKSSTKNIPECIVNPCQVDGYVQFQNQCFLLNGENGCESYKMLIGRKVILTVDPTTLQLQCRDEVDNFKCENFCCRGGLRDSIGKCDKQQIST